MIFFKLRTEAFKNRDSALKSRESGTEGIKSYRSLGNGVYRRTRRCDKTGNKFSNDHKDYKATRKPDTAVRRDAKEVLGHREFVFSPASYRTCARE